MCFQHTVIVILYVSLAMASTEYYELKGTLTWSNALSSCDIAIPDITVKHDGYGVKMSHELRLDRVWVGYYMMTTVFNYLGCKRIDSDQDTDVSIMTVNTPGLCYSVCKKLSKDTVGISGEKCYCMDSIHQVDLHAQSCNRKCNMTGLACGGSEHMSVYQVDNNGTCTLQQNTDIRSQCVTIERYPSTDVNISWKHCDNYLHTLCYRVDNTTFTAKYSMPWIQSVNLSLKECRSPLLYGDITSIHTPRINPTWSGVVRSDAIYTYKELKACHSSGVRYGYLSKQNSEVVLSFNNNPKDVKAVLCRTPEIPTPFPHPSSTGHGTDNTNQAIKVSLTEARSSPAPDPTKKSMDQKQREGTVLVPVVVSLAVVCSIVVIVTIVILKRRKKLPDCFNRSGLDAGTEHRSESIHLPEKFHKKSHTVSPYDTERNSSQPTKDVGNLKSTKKEFENEYVHTYAVIEPDAKTHDDGLVDSFTNSTRNDIEKQTCNVYNKFNSDVNATYDHVHNKKQRSHPSDETYDTTEKAVMRLRAGAARAKDLGEIDTDTYNHINETNKNGRQDNVYGIPNKDNHLYGDITKSAPQEILCEGDTYSHLERKPVETMKTDNFYDTTKNSEA